MSIYNQISAIIFLLIIFTIFKFLCKRNKNSYNKGIISKEKMNPNFEVYELHNEEMLRKNWLISFFMFTAVSVILSFVNFIEEHIFIKLVEETGIAFSVIVGLSLSSLFLIPWVWITYHCSYKKRGTAWLKWTMISLPLREILSIAKGELNQVAEWDSFTWFIVMMTLGIEIFYWTNCLRLHKVNSSKYKKEQALKENVT